MENLSKLVAKFQQQKLLSNPLVQDFGVSVNAFVSSLQAGGSDLSQWGEDDWWEALMKLGVPESEIPGMLENLASWAVVDNFNYS